MPKPELPAYGDRPGMDLYVASPSPKPKLIAKMAHQICNIVGRKLLIFAGWPLIQWSKETFLQNTGFNILGIQAIHKNLERDALVNSFNDPSSNSRFSSPV